MSEVGLIVVCVAAWAAVIGVCWAGAWVIVKALEILFGGPSGKGDS